MASELAAMLVPIGVVGAGLAVICAVVAGIAALRAAGGLCGGAVGLWIPCAMLSVAASFAHQWMPLLVSLGALAVALILGALVGMLLPRFVAAGSGEFRRIVRPKDTRNAVLRPEV